MQSRKITIGLPVDKRDAILAGNHEQFAGPDLREFRHLGN